jgi:cobalt/nickel transport system permease protein
MKAGFVERTIASLMSASEYAATAEDVALSRGALQRVDARVKVAGLFGLILVAASSHKLSVILSILAVALALALFSHIPFKRLLHWFWLPVLLFTGTIALPAVFLVAQGWRSAAFLLSRAETASTLSALLVLTTPWPWILKSLRTFRCPVIVVAVLGMTYRYIFVILQTASEMFESRKSRTVGVMEASERRRLAASAVGVLLGKSLQLSGDVHLAMQARGFRGEVYVLHDFHTRTADWFWMAAFSVGIATAFWYGR